MFTKSSLLIGTIFTLIAINYLRNWLKDINYDISAKFKTLKGKRFSDLKEYDEGLIYYRFVGWLPAIFVEILTVGFLSVFIFGFIFAVITKGVDWDTW